MSKLFTALENEEVVKSDDTLEQSMLDNEVEQQEIGESLQQQEDAIETGEVLQKIEEAETPEAALEIAREHLLNKIGYSKSFSLESFNNDLNNSLSVAQEGVLSRIGNAIKRTFTTSARFEEKLEQAIDKLKNNGSKTDLLVDPGWSKYLIATSNKTITSTEVMAFMKQVENIIDIKELNKYLDKISNIYNDIAQELTKNTFVSSKEVVTNINAIYKESQDIINDFEKMAYKYNRPSNKDRYPNYEPIQYKDAVKLQDYLIKEYSAELYDSTEYRKFEASVDNLNDIMYQRRTSSIKFNLFGLEPKDVNASVNIINRLNKSIYSLIDVVTFRNRAAYAAMRYIEASAA